MPLQKAHEREQQEQIRAQQRPQDAGGYVHDVEEISDEEVDEKVNSLIAEGKHAQAQRLAARFTPEARAFRLRERERALSIQQQQRYEQQQQQQFFDKEIDRINEKYGEQSPAVWKEMQRTLSRVPPNFRVDVEDLFLLAKAKTEKEASSKPRGRAPMSPPRPGVQPVKPAREESDGDSDEQYLSKRRTISLNDLLGKKK
jgi:hypothetical protein